MTISPFAAIQGAVKSNGILREKANFVSMNRRDFLREGSIAGLTGALGAGLVENLRAEPFAPQVTDASNTKKEPPPAPVATAVIGLGTQGREAISALARQNSAPRYICDVYEGKIFVKKAQALAPAATFVKDYRAILDDKSVTSVIVATPTHKHKQIVLDALQAGKNVYCEAPLSNTMEEAKAIAQAGAGAKTIFMPGLQWRSNGQHKHIHKFVKTGVLGRAISGRAVWNKRTSWRVVWPVPEREAELNWRLDPNVSLGLAGEVGMHEIDVASWYLREAPLSVTGWGGVLEYRDGRTVADTVQVIAEYPNSVRYTFDASLSSTYEGSYEMLTGTMATVLVRDQRGWMFKEVDSPLLGWEVFARKDDYAIGSIANGTGDKVGTGIALVANATKQLALGKDPGKVGTDVSKTALYQSIETFLESVRNNKKPEVTPLDGYRATVVAIKSNEAVATGTKITFQKEWFEL